MNSKTAITGGLLTITILCIMTIWFIRLQYNPQSPSTAIHEEQWIELRTHYEQGFADACDALALLDLENRLTNKKMTWGEMSKKAKKRFGVEAD